MKEKNLLIIRLTLMVWLIISVFLTSTTVVLSSPSFEDQPVSSASYLYAPYTNSRVRVQQGYISHFAYYDVTHKECGYYDPPSGKNKKWHSVGYTPPSSKKNGEFCSHDGIDFILGTPQSGRTTWKSFEVVATIKGKVLCGYSSVLGYYITQEQQYKKDKIKVRYVHLIKPSSELKKICGTIVSPGTKIGDAGDTGSATDTGIHLHFDVWRNGIRIDPYGINGMWSAYPPTKSVNWSKLIYVWYIENGNIKIYPQSTITKTFTPSVTLTATPTKTATFTSTFTSSPTFTPTFTSTSTPSATATYSLTPTDTPTSTPTIFNQVSDTPTCTQTPSVTIEPPTPTPTLTLTLLPITDTPTFTLTPTETSSTPTTLPTFTATPFKTLYYFQPVLNPSYTGNLCTAGWLRINGWQDKYSYLTLNTNQAEASGYTATYSVKVEKDGYYKVSNWVAQHDPIAWSCPTKIIYWDSSKTPFKVQHANGPSTVYIDQSQIADDWASVGTYYFVGGTTYNIIIFDLNNEADLSRTISVGTLRLEYTP